MTDADKRYKEMHDLYMQGLTLAEVGKQFGISASAVQGGFKRRGLPTRSNPKNRSRHSFVNAFDDSALVKAKSEWDRLDPKVKGSVAEGYVENRLAEMGFDVWKPFMNNHKSDLGVYKRGRLIRVQVKSATYDPDSKRYRTTLKTRDKRGKHIEYEDGTIDFFIVFCPGVMAFYVIPFEVTVDNSAVNLFPHRERYMAATGFDWEVYRDAFHFIRSFEVS